MGGAGRIPAGWPLLVLLLILAGCATPHLEPVPRATGRLSIESDHIRTADGARLPLTVWQPAEAPRAVALALHGFNDYRAGWDGLGVALAAAGIQLYAYDQRGFGAAPGRGLWFGGARLAADARAVLDELRRRHPGLPMHLLGESMGGAVALAAVADNPAPDIQGLVLLAPAVWSRDAMAWPQRAALWLLAHTRPAQTLTGTGLDIVPTDNPAVRRQLRADPLVLKESRVDALWGMVDLMDAAVMANPPTGLPTLILYGRQDRVIPRKPTCRWLARLAAGHPPDARPRLALYPRGYHMLTRDLQAAVVLEDLAAWLRDPAARLPSGQEANMPPAELCGG